jgi:uncharacterized damage-inducible protein DinB
VVVAATITEGRSTGMTVQDALQRQIAATDAGDPWYGSSRAVLLEGLTAREAAAHPIPGGHSIWELVLHMTAWTQEVERRLAGNEPGEPQAGDWPPVGAVTAARWRAACSALAEAHASLLAAVAALPADRWSDPVGKLRQPALGTGVTIGGMLVGIAQHDAYHIGQLAILRQALR